MRIPKGLILYKAPRHQHSFPNDIKRGYYSPKMVTSISATDHNRHSNFRRKYQQNLIREVQIRFDEDGRKTLEIIKLFSKFRGIKKCSINWFSFHLDQEIQNLRIRILQRVFKTLKRIKHLTMESLDLNHLPRNPKTFKTLMQLNNLESLIFSRFHYSTDSKDLTPFIQVAKTASKRRSWPNVKSLQISSFYPKISRLSPDDLTQTLQNLLEFMQGLKSCPSLHECASFVLSLPKCEYLTPEQADILKEILRNAPVLNGLEIGDYKHFSEVLGAFEQSKGFKKLELRALQALQKDSDLSILNSMSSLQELKLSRCHEDGVDSLLYRDLLIQVQPMKNLRALTLEFWKNLSRGEELKVELSKVILGLPNLESLKVRLLYFSTEKGKEFDRMWLLDVLEAIGQKSTLRKLYLKLAAFDCEHSDLLFKALCESLKNLKELDELALSIERIGDQELLMLIKSLSKSTKIQNLQLDISRHNSKKFQSETFLLLIESITNNFPVLSRLSLLVAKVIVSPQVFQLLYQMVWKLRGLNSIELGLQGLLGKGVDFKALKKEMNKRLTSDISVNNLHVV